jgi:hypothetical protein
MSSDVRTRRSWVKGAPLIVLALGLGGAACQKPEDDADLLPPPGWTPKATPPLVVSATGPVRFGSGWYPIESDPQGSWRWMGKSAEIQVPGLPTNGRLKFLGWAPVELLATPPVMRMSFNGHEIGRFVMPRGHFTKAYDVPEDLQQGKAESIVRLETSATATAPGDPRALGFSLVSLAWTLAP